MKPMPSPRGTNREGLYLPATMAFDSIDGLVYDVPPPRGERTMGLDEVGRYGRRMARELLGMDAEPEYERTITQKEVADKKAKDKKKKAMDVESEEEEREEKEAEDEEEEMSSAAEKYFGKDAWAKFKKARDARRKGAKDEPPEFPGRQRPGGGMDPERAHDMSFASRFPGAGRIGVEMMGIQSRPLPTPKECVDRARHVLDYSSRETDFNSRFPGAAKIGRL